MFRYCSLRITPQTVQPVSAGPLNRLNVAALLITWASLMLFFSLFKPRPKKRPAQIMRFFWGWVFVFGVGFLLSADGQS